MFNDTSLVSILSESEKSGDSDCVNKPVEGELESITFRVKGKFLLLAEEVAGTLGNLQIDAQAQKPHVLLRM